MGYQKFAQQSVSNGAGPEAARLARARAALGELRHIGFHRFNLPVDCERVSDGPSPFHELGYCVSGEIRLMVWRSFEPVESFSARTGDFFFLPAGTSYSIHNSSDRVANLIVAAAKDDVDVEVMPFEASNVIIDDIGATKQRDPGVNECEQVLKSNGGISRSEQDGHVVLFFDERAEEDASDRTVANLFDKHLLAREFSVTEAQLPDLSFNFHDPLVIRPIDNEHLEAEYVNCA